MEELTKEGTFTFETKDGISFNSQDFVRCTPQHLILKETLKMGEQSRLLALIQCVWEMYGINHSGNRPHLAMQLLISLSFPPLFICLPLKMGSVCMKISATHTFVKLLRLKIKVLTLLASWVLHFKLSAVVYRGQIPKKTYLHSISYNPDCMCDHQVKKLVCGSYLSEFFVFERDFSIIADLPQGGTKAPLVSCNAQRRHTLHALWSDPWDTMYTLCRGNSDF